MMAGDEDGRPWELGGDGGADADDAWGREDSAERDTFPSPRLMRAVGIVLVAAIVLYYGGVTVIQLVQENLGIWV